MESSRKAVFWKRNYMEGLSTVSQGTERRESDLSNSREVSVVSTQRTEKEEWEMVFNPGATKNVVQEKKCDHGITCGSLVKNNVITE